MKFSLSWLKKHLDTDASIDEIVETMLRVGLEVEAVENPAERLKDFTIGHVLTAEKHPDADKLKVCTVATKDGEMQIVCGAPNARAGINIAYAPVGAYVPGIDVTLSKAKIRGVESHGMMCSVRELEMGDDHDGILEAPEDAEIGAPIAEVMGLTDPVIDFEVTPNRPDTNGVDGVARDLAAAGLGRLITPSAPEIEGQFANPQKIILDFPEVAINACTIFAGRIIRGVKNGPSPEWLQQALLAIGLRPINALADITNYISYDRARPLHVYDAAKLTGAIGARLGREGESFEALDGKTYQVDESMCVIADEARVLGLGGVMGGEYSGCTNETKDVFIESAWFDPTRTAKTGRKTGIISDARYRFERGVDPQSCVPGLELATQLVLEICGGQPGEIEIAGQAQVGTTLIDFPPSEVKRLTGLDVPEAEMKRILEALGFIVETGGIWKVLSPSSRPDIEGKADLVEEIARIIGFEALPSTLLPRLEDVTRPKYSKAQDRVRLSRRALASRGFLETVLWSFCDEKQARLFGGGQKDLILANPISSDLGVMRPSALPGLIDALRRNSDRGRKDLNLFEIGPAYRDDTPQGQEMLAVCVRMSNPPRHWQGAAPQADLYTAKADALAVLESIGAPVANLQAMAKAPDYYHPGRSGVLGLGPKNILACFGELHPFVAKEMDIEGRVVMAEIFLDAVPTPKAKLTKTKPGLEKSDYQSVARDFAFVVPREMEADKLLRALKGADKKLIASVALFDVYQGKGLGDDEKSLAVEITLQPKDRTMTDEEIEAVSAKIIQAAQKTGARLRG